MLQLRGASAAPATPVPVAHAELESAERLAQTGDIAEARSAYERARLSYEREGDRLGEANALMGLGHLELTLGRNVQARKAYAEARILYTQLDDRLGWANALVGIAQAEKSSDPARAGGHFGAAALLYKQLGLPEREAQALAAAERLEGPRDE